MSSKPRDEKRSHRRSRSRSPRRRRSRSRSKDRRRSRSGERRREKSKSPERKDERKSIMSTKNIKPPDPELLRALIAKNPNVGADPTATRQARRVYIGGLPTTLGLTESMMTTFFTHASKQLGILTETPVINTWISPDGIFCFVEYRSVADCTTAIALLQTLTLAGRPVRVGRPVDYKPLPANVADYIVPMAEIGNLNITATTANASLPKLSSTPSHTNLIAMSLGHAVAKQAQEMKKDEVPDPVQELQTMLQYSNLPTLIHLAHTALLNQAALRVPAMPPTCILVMEFLILPEDIRTEELYQEIFMDVEDECIQYGKVLKVVIPRNEPGLGKIYVKFSSKDEANTARLALHGRAIDGRKIVCPFYDETKFENGEF